MFLVMGVSWSSFQHVACYRNGCESGEQKVPTDQHYALFSVGSLSWCHYILGSCCDTATHSCWNCYPYQAILVGYATPTSETSCGLPAVDPDVAEQLAVALCEVGPGFICFDLYNDVPEGREGKDS